MFVPPELAFLQSTEGGLQETTGCGKPEGAAATRVTGGMQQLAAAFVGSLLMVLLVASSQPSTIAEACSFNLFCLGLLAATFPLQSFSNCSDTWGGLSPSAVAWPTVELGKPQAHKAPADVSAFIAALPNPWPDINPK